MPEENRSRDVKTRTGLKLHIRPVQNKDEGVLAEFFTHVSPADLRFRFLAAVKEVGQERIRAMVRIDHSTTENFLAFDGDLLIASAMVACATDFTRAEVAISVRADYKRKGVAWELLHHAARYAQAKGVKVLESVESRENHEAIELEREQGFVASSHPDDPSLILIRKDLG